jgi:TM2 domain-containing membrane protein YozV
MPGSTIPGGPGNSDSGLEEERRMNEETRPGADKKTPAGICGILLGAFGVHKFILGYTTEGVIMLLVTLVGGAITCGAASGIMGLIGLIEGIIYLTKSDEDFVRLYIENKKGWF